MRKEEKREKEKRERERASGYMTIFRRIQTDNQMILLLFLHVKIFFKTAEPTHSE